MISDIITAVAALIFAVCAGLCFLKMGDSEKRKNDAVASLAESMKVLAASKENSDDQKN